ncbi:MAG: response regulator [Nitrospirota bacterium]
MLRKILIVEDNEQNRIMVRDILQYHGYEVIEAHDGEEGLSMARRHMPALVLMDIQMPVMDGLSAGQALRNDPGTSAIKLIALTSFAMKGDREKIMRAGFDDYIAKPIDTRRLPEIVKKYVGSGI